MIRLAPVGISKLTLQNAAALLTLPLYLSLRPFLRWFGMLRPGQGPHWVVGGHSGRLYADNAAVLHQQLLTQGRDPYWVSSDAALTADLQRRGARVLRRNSFAARLAIENAAVLAYSHNLSDMDHVLQRWVALPALKVHLNHCMSHLKAWGSSRFPNDLPQGAPGIPFDFLLASSPREQTNLRESFAGANERVVIGGGAHLDLFMRARSQPPKRQITYFPTFRETPQAKAQLNANMEALAAHPKLQAWLAQHDYTLSIVGHVNSGREASIGSERVRFAAAQDLTELVLETELLISDYSGLICDYLALDRPIIFFPFDKSEYLAKRKLYVNYDDFAFGPEVQSVDAVVDLIVSGRFRERGAYADKRARWERELFPALEPIYAERTLATISDLHAQRRRDA